MRIGLTGSIGTGKSTVAKMFAACGAEVVYADQLGHDVMAPTGPAYQPIIEKFQSKVPDLLDSFSEINRKALGKFVFTPGNETEREALESIVHPHVNDRFWMAANRIPQSRVLIYESAILYEFMIDLQMHAVILVTCDPDEAAARCFARNGMTPDEVAYRRSIELKHELKLQNSRYVIDTNRDLEFVQADVQRIYPFLKEASEIMADSRNVSRLFDE